MLLKFHLFIYPIFFLITNVALELKINIYATVIAYIFCERKFSHPFFKFGILLISIFLLYFGWPDQISRYSLLAIVFIFQFYTFIIYRLFNKRVALVENVYLFFVFLINTWLCVEFFYEG